MAGARCGPASHRCHEVGSRGPRFVIDVRGGADLPSRNHATYEYENVAVHGNDVSGKWEAGRTIPHISQLSKLTTPKGVATATPTNDFQWSYVSDAKGNLTRVTDPLGYFAAYAYNADGTTASQTDENNHSTTYVSYDANGLATEIRDAKSQTTRFGFDADGYQLWLQDALHANDTGANPREYRQYFDYDSFHRRGATSEPKSTSLARGTLIWTATDYDPNDNVTSQASPAFSPGGGARNYHRRSLEMRVGETATRARRFARAAER